MVASSDIHYIAFKTPLTWWTFNGLAFDYIFILSELIQFGNMFNSYGMGRECKGLRNKFMVLQDGRNFYPSGSLKELSWENNVLFHKKDVKI
jgi:hypothetical protein